jgi:nitrogenase molybdenum-iron protein alpha chain
MPVTNKNAEMNPQAIKEEMLKKYPPKVARKRAKQILISEALETGTPEITANVRTIPGIITMRGCTYAGCKG